MSWIQEVLRALLLSLGVFEVITNTTFLLRADGLILARRQHQEMPIGISDTKIKLKVILMLLYGIAFFIISLTSFIFHKYLHLAIILILSLFTIYAISEAIFYRYWRTWGFAVITLLLLLVSIFS